MITYEIRTPKDLRWRNGVLEQRWHVAISDDGVTPYTTYDDWLPVPTVEDKPKEGGSNAMP